MARALGDGWISERSAVNEKDVEPAIVIKVEEQAARPEDLGQELLVARAADVTEVQPRGHGNVCELSKFRRDRSLALQTRGGCAQNDERGEQGWCGRPKA